MHAEPTLVVSVDRVDYVCTLTNIFFVVVKLSCPSTQQHNSSLVVVSHPPTLSEIIRSNARVLASAVQLDRTFIYS